MEERLIMVDREEPGPVILSVSCPGGMARQYRVQVCDRDNPTAWKMAGSFRGRAAAEECVQRLTMAGEQARVVECRSLPTAA